MTTTRDELIKRWFRHCPPPFDWAEEVPYLFFDVPFDELPNPMGWDRRSIAASKERHPSTWHEE